MRESVPNRPVRSAPGTYLWDVPDGWRQGRGAFGGLVLSALARAMRDEGAPADQPLRSLTAVIPGAVLAGEAEIRVETLRRGNNTSTMDGRILQDGEARSQATAIFARRRNALDTWNEWPTPPQMRPWRDVDPLAFHPPMGPDFSQHVEFRVIDGLPFAGKSTRETSGWVRLREPSKEPDELDLIMLIDAWWGASLAAMTAPRPGATMSFAMQILGDWAGLDPTAPVFFRGTTPASWEGYTVDLRELWSEDGRLLALNQQSLAIIK
ncbi:MAG: thioesterase family protein [Myxococcales bacterium]|nr:thioesterase family protein [Myxococcales bacterium]